MRTLCIDIGGSGIKAIVLDGAGAPVSERVRVETPEPAEPDTVLHAVEELARHEGSYDRVSVGFPGVVVEGVTKTAVNLDGGWSDFQLSDELARRLGKPVRVANDAGIQGLGVIEGRGVEMIITLGTGLGCGLYIDGRYVPNIELGHHPFRNKKTYEERLCNAERKKIGNKRWNRRVRDTVEQMAPIFNFRKLYIGGGNARHVDASKLPSNVSVVDNMAGLLGGIKLWG
jgi:polyphosphate glucokinase